MGTRTIECEFPPFHGPDIDGSDSVLQVQLQANALDQLLSEAAQDRRLYEVWALQQPGDVCAYLEVRLLSGESSLRARVSPCSDEGIATVDDLVSDRRVSLARFEDLFPEHDDTGTEAPQWTRLRTGRVREFLATCLEEARQHLNELRLRNVIAEHVVRRLELKEHPFSFLSRDKALVASSRSSSPSIGNTASASFLAKLASCLMDASIDSVLIAGNSIDPAVIRATCIEQRSRVELFGGHPWQTFPVAVFGDAVEDVPVEWESAVAIDWEGTPRGDLWINLQRDAAEKDYWASRPRGRMALCARDRGEIAGFDRETGDGWTLYVAHKVDSQWAKNSSPRGSKLTAYRKLVIERKQCRECKSLTNPSDPALQRYDGAEIGPWTRWQRDLEAQIIIVGQDWGGSVNYDNQKGRDGDSVTNKNLRHLLKKVCGIAIDPPTSAVMPQSGGVYLTNSVLCIKPGADNGDIRASCFAACCDRFLQPQIELVAPRVVVCLGLRAHKSVLRAYPLSLAEKMALAESRLRDPPGEMLAAVRAPIRSVKLASGSCVKLVPVFHCGALGVRNRSLDQQEKDWQRVKDALAANECSVDSG